MDTDTVKDLKPDDNQDIIQGTVEKINYHSPETGYTVLRLVLESSSKKSSSHKLKPQESSLGCVGTYLQPKVGANLKLTGSFTVHPRYGRQFQFTSYEEIVPSSQEGLIDYLCSGDIKGIHKVLAKRIVKKFGANTIQILDDHPEDLLSISGIGPDTFQKITTSWNEHKQSRNLVLFLKPHGFSMNMCAQILRQFGAEALEICQENPYRLALDIPGVSFHLADNLGHFLGFPDDHHLRREAYLIHCLKEASRYGHVFLPHEKLETEAAKFLNLSSQEFEDTLNALLAQKRIRLESETMLKAFEGEVVSSPNLGTSSDVSVYLPHLYKYEVGTAANLTRILNAPKSTQIQDPERLAKAIIKAEPITLGQEQREAVEMAAKSKILVVTGGPGTGKTTIINIIIKLFATQNAQILLAAPTGRAAKRMFETTGQPAQTIHRLLAYSPINQDFTHNRNEPLKCDLLIVDEASMIDIGLAYHLLEAIPDGCTLLLVGDIFQLPSVGPGSVLSDIINSKVIPIVKLTQIFRQSSGSVIVRNAHLINKGEVPPLNEKNTDFFFISDNDPAHCAQTITDLVAERLPNYYHFDILNDIQVLSPMHKGEVGISALNKLLQDRLNPFGQEIKRLEYTYRLNDKVMQIHNNYEKDVFNGDLGVISDIDTKERILRIRFEENKTVDYKFDELDDIIPAYAISIHKSQGSEYPCVVIPVSLTQYWMLERNLIYTGVTRGKKIVIVIGEQAAFVKAIQTNTMRKRFTRLELRLRLSQNCPDFLEKLNSYSVYNSKCNYEENDSDSDDEKCLLDILRF